MFFSSNINNKTVKELRKNKGFTARELANRLKIDTSEIMKVDNMKFKEVKEPLYSRLLPIFRGDDLDRIPWL
ncbi:MAG: transcriptional regulator [Syntrophomonadaceae bacterium]|nr:transcriptional regulator [Syntrophomonadaceae bacterium]